jgi:membrane fusion protein (multidrug efflux system)
MPDSGALIDEATARVQPAPKRSPSPRWRLLGLLGGVVLVGAAGYGVYWVAEASRHVATDNAYVGADTAEVTPLISGPVAQVLVSETQGVRAGQPLVIIDPADADNAVAQARASLAQAERQVKGYFANDASLAAQVGSRQAAIAQADAQIVSAQGDLDRAGTDLRRREALSASGAVSGDELTSAQNRYSTAKSALAAAQANRAAAVANRGAAQGAREMNLAMISGADVDHNPDVLAARARLDAALLTRSRTVLRAPIDGVIAKKSVQIGQQVAPGQVAMQIVPTRAVYVDANFKEVQLAKVCVGQPVILTSDLYGDGVKFHGRVKGLSGGTGSAFSLIPAQNASGNWIKIVQRLPVRVTLDPADLDRHPLRIGLSMKADIDVSQCARQVGGR